MDNKVKELMIKMRSQYSNIISLPCPKLACINCHFYTDSLLYKNKTCALSEFFMLMYDLFKELEEE